MPIPFLLPLLGAAAGGIMGGDLKSALYGGLLGFLPGALAGAGGAGAAAGAKGIEAVAAANAANAAQAAVPALTPIAAQGASAAELAKIASLATTPGNAASVAAAQSVGTPLIKGLAINPGVAVTQAAGDAAKLAAMPEPSGIQAIGQGIGEWADKHKLQAALMAGTLGSTLAMEAPKAPGQESREPSNAPAHVLPRGEVVPYSGVNSSAPSTYGLDSYTNPASYNQPDKYSQMPGSQEHVYFPDATKDGWMAGVQSGGITPNDPQSQSGRGGVWERMLEGWLRRVQRRSDGGPVIGPGGPRDDEVPAIAETGEIYALSNNEHILPADYVRIVGGGDYQRGHQTIMQQVAAARRAVYG